MGMVFGTQKSIQSVSLLFLSFVCLYLQITTAIRLLEHARERKIIGSPLEAYVGFATNDEKVKDALNALGSEGASLFGAVSLMRVALG